MKFSFRPYRRQLAMPLRTATAQATHREGWYIRLEDDAGCIGIGDAACWPGFGSSIEATQQTLNGWCMTPPAELLDIASIDSNRAIDSALAYGSPEAVHALELARLDLEAQRRGLPLWARLDFLLIIFILNKI